MFLVRWIVHLAWYVITLPLHLLAWVVKSLILGPLITLVVLIALVVVCVVLVFPGSLASVNLPAIPVPDAISGFSSELQRLVAPGPAPSPTPLPALAPTQVTCVLEANDILVQWPAPDAGGVQWYQVVRKSVHDTDWHRIGIVSARDTIAGHYEFKDTALQHSVTYLYGVVAIGADGAESDVTVSHTQIVAP